MPSVKNPNGPSKNRLAARAAKARKTSQKRSEENKHKIAKVDVRRGARPGLLPNSGPNAKVSSKKARKLQKKLGYAMQRKAEAEGEAVMTDAPADEEERLGPDETEMEGIL
ncbi:hypothetical protein ISF_01495 [Cordyceps fumosorosea ARSEF 2679]|uniref:Ribosome biogenesis protein ALB1 n=1 Tax=Cordyceps fumosorosea (strain ARSEF 2679) TaxID=1081104 RepID=A0A162JQT0_CORFA|nr:hypothetical protein ISF_01495 [Cordyceps fumosorosea ARSEF 2679]OAA72422.1 hypothetical protein ISF_01495 [Cordyceps fumosorosea ARSEF 2679]